MNTYMYNYIVVDIFLLLNKMKWNYTFKLYMYSLYIETIQNKLPTVFYVGGFYFQKQVQYFFIDPLLLVINQWDRYYFDLKRKTFDTVMKS